MTTLVRKFSKTPSKGPIHVQNALIEIMIFIIDRQFALIFRIFTSLLVPFLVGLSFETFVCIARCSLFKWAWAWLETEEKSNQKLEKKC